MSEVVSGRSQILAHQSCHHMECSVSDRMVWHVARCRRGWTPWRRGAREILGPPRRATCPHAISRGQSRMQPPAASQVWRMSCTDDV